MRQAKLTIEQIKIGLFKLFNQEISDERKEVYNSWHLLEHFQKLDLCIELFITIRPFNIEFLFKNERYWSQKDRAIYQQEISARARYEIFDFSKKYISLAQKELHNVYGIYIDDISDFFDCVVSWQYSPWRYCD